MKNKKEERVQDEKEKSLLLRIIYKKLQSIEQHLENVVKKSQQKNKQQKNGANWDSLETRALPTRLFLNSLLEIYACDACDLEKN